MQSAYSPLRIVLILLSHFVIVILILKINTISFRYNLLLHSKVFHWPKRCFLLLAHLVLQLLGTFVSFTVRKYYLFICLL